MTYFSFLSWRKWHHSFVIVREWAWLANCKEVRAHAAIGPEGERICPGEIVVNTRYNPVKYREVKSEKWEATTNASRLSTTVSITSAQPPGATAFVEYCWIHLNTTVFSNITINEPCIPSRSLRRPYLSVFADLSEGRIYRFEVSSSAAVDITNTGTLYSCNPYDDNIDSRFMSVCIWLWVWRRTETGKLIWLQWTCVTNDFV